MASRPEQQHTCCSCCCDQAESGRRDVWDRPVWNSCDVVVAFQISHTTLDTWRGDQDARFPAPADLPGRSVRWCRDGILDWFQHRYGLANRGSIAGLSANGGGSAPEAAVASGTSEDRTRADELPPIPRR